MELRIGHSTRVKPHVDEVGLPVHGPTRRTHKNYIVNIRTVQIYLLIIILAVIAGNESFFLIWILRHHTGLYSEFDLIVECLHRVDARFLLAILCTPDRKRGAPVTRTGKVPVLQILQPFTEASRTG